MHITHEGVDKVRKSKVDLLMTRITQFVINGGEGPNKMFYRMMTLVANIRDLGGNDLDDHIIFEDHVQSGFVSQWPQ